MKLEIHEIKDLLLFAKNELKAKTFKLDNMEVEFSIISLVEGEGGHLSIDGDLEEDEFEKIAKEEERLKREYDENLAYSAD